MNKYYISFAVLTCFVVAVFIAGVIVVSPSSKRDQTLDKNRIDDFSQIRTQLDNYYEANQKLPDSLKDISGVNTKDPGTKEDYEYKKINTNSYQLCATFSTDGKEEQTGSYTDYDSSRKHIKGYDCVDFKIGDYIINSREGTRYKRQTYYNPTPTAFPTIAPIISILNVDSYPQGIPMYSAKSYYSGITSYSRTFNGAIATIVNAPASPTVDGKTYTFSSWTGCNNDTFADQYCTVLVNGSTLSITANYILQASQ